MKLNKIFKVTSILLLVSFVFVIANKEKTIDVVLNNISKSTIDDTIYKNAKVDPIYPIQTLRKTGNDADRINVLFIGDNYGENEPLDSFSNTMYKDVVVPWLSTVYPSNYEDTYNEMTRGTRVPFQTFLNDKINVYSIQPNYIYNSTFGPNSKNTFLGMYKNDLNDNSLVQVPNFGNIKVNALSYDASKNFLEDGGIIINNTVGLIRNGGYGRANALDGYRANTTAKTSTHIHEMGHSIFNLSDEYGSVAYRGVNRIYLPNNYDIEDITWKEFLNFRGVTVWNITGNDYRPADNCMMANSNWSINDFCEVCTHHIIKTGVKLSQEELFYIADPQLTPHEDTPNWKDDAYTTQYLQLLEVYDKNITNVKNKSLEFRTVVDNLTLKDRNIKLKVSISNKSNNQEVFSEESEIFNIKSGQLKGLCLITNNKAPSNLENNKYSIIGQVIDVDTNEVLATNLDRLNYYYLSQQYIHSFLGNKTYKVTINFLDKDNNPLPNIKPTTLIKRDKEKFKLESILFNGYRLNKIESKINEKFQINGKDLVFNYYYDPLPYKNLKLKLVDENNYDSVIQEKTIKVYEGQNFIPTSSDFFLYDLKEFNENNPKANENWKYSIQAPKNSINYISIDDNKTELIYQRSNLLPSYHLNRTLKIVQGENLYNAINGYSNKFWNNSYEFNFSEYDSRSIIYNTVDVSIPGEYYYTYLYGGSLLDAKTNDNLLKQAKVIVEKNPNPSYKPNELDSELERLKLISVIWLNGLEYQEGTFSDFEAINESNLLSNILNLNLNYDRFNYEVVDFTKLYPGINNEVFYGYKFKIKVNSKLNNESKITNFFDKYVWFKEEDSSSPTDEIDKELARVNSLNLELINNTLTQEEANNINKTNILQNVKNWVSMSEFAYEIIEFKHINNSFQFNIKITDNKNFRISKLFSLSYTLKISIDEEEKLLDQEIQRINNLSNSMSLNKNTFTQEEANAINQSNFSNQISNWNQVTLNVNKYNYEITNFSKNNNQFIFNIKISLISNSSLFRTSNQFMLSYQINNEIDSELINEQNRINDLKIKLSKKEFNQFEIKDISNNNNKIVNYLDGLILNNNFNYDYEVSMLNNEMVLKIKIIKKDTGNYLTSNEFKLDYVFVENGNYNDNSLSIILASTLTPIGVIGITAGTGGVIWFKKNKRRY
ncbi:MAG: hypothetical protein HDR43_00680 [Mycoplasma sp.]|nr:hypothetical protein [Mycoplasma sp.]